MVTDGYERLNVGTAWYLVENRKWTIVSVALGSPSTSNEGRRVILRWGTDIELPIRHFPRSAYTKEVKSPWSSA